jgi:hypothetical protein
VVVLLSEDVGWGSKLGMLVVAAVGTDLLQGSIRGRWPMSILLLIV